MPTCVLFAEWWENGLQYSPLMKNSIECPSLDRLSIESVQVRGASWHFANKLIFYFEESLSLRPTTNL
jgi:hypothetical protein